MKEEMWFYRRGFYKVLVRRLKHKKKIQTWKEAVCSCEYFFRNGDLAWDFIIPTKLCVRTARLLGLALEESRKSN